MKTWFASVAFSGLIAVSSFGYEWSSALSPETLGDGAVTLVYKDGAVSEFNVQGGWADSNVLTGDGITFASGGKVKMMSLGGFTFLNAVTSLGTLTVTKASGANGSVVSFLGGLSATTLSVDSSMTNVVRMTTDLATAVKGNGAMKMLVEDDLTFSGAVGGTVPASSTNSTKLVLARAEDGATGAKTLTLTGDNTTTGSIDLYGSAERPLKVLLSNLKSIPLPNGFINVHSGASLCLDGETSVFGNSTESTGNRHLSTIAVFESGELVHSKNHDTKQFLPRKQNIVLDGGCLRLRDGANPSITYARFIANNLTFKDDAFVTNAVPMVGREGGTWTVTGTRPSRCDPGVALVGSKDKTTDKKDDLLFYIEVEDVTKGPETDFTLGAIYKYNKSGGYCAPNTTTATGYGAGLSNNFAVVKTGAGTLELTKSDSNHLVGPMRIQDGTLRLGANKALDTAAYFSFEGGSLEVAANCTNQIAGLVVKTNACIKIEAGACLTVAAIDEWRTDAQTSKEYTLTITPPATGKKYLRFANASGVPVVLTDDQLAAIRTAEGHKVRQDDEGYVREERKGAILIFR